MFLLICTLVMWVMIFAVGLLYVSMVPHVSSESLLKRFMLTMITTIIAWLFVGYPVAMNDGNAFFGYWTVEWVEQHYFSLNGTDYLTMVFQLCFCLYAVTMLIGSVIDRLRLRDTIWVVTAWVLFCYAPLAHMIWHDNGWLAQHGVNDFSGALVVHLSAGLSAYALAAVLNPHPNSDCSQVKPNLSENHAILWQVLATVLIAFGWFGFNMGPANEWNVTAVLSFFNSFVAIIAGILAFIAYAYMRERQFTVGYICDGVICGLVTSTAAVGYVNPIQMFLISFLACLTINVVDDRLLSHVSVSDVVSSFAINGIGGVMGALGFGLLVTSQSLGSQLLGTLVTIGCVCLVMTPLSLVLRRGK